MNSEAAATMAKLRLEKSTNFMTRGIMEIESLQSETNSAERFTLDTYGRFTEAFCGGFLRKYASCDVFYRKIDGTLSKFESPNTPPNTQNPQNAKERLFFIPIDSPFNFSRALTAQTGTAILYQAKEDGDNFQTKFAILYMPKFAKLVYAPTNGIVFSGRQKRLKMIIRKNLKTLLLLTNDDFIKQGGLQYIAQKGITPRQAHCSGSIVSDASAMAHGSADITLYHNTTLLYAQVIATVVSACGGQAIISPQSTQQSDLASLFSQQPNTEITHQGYTLQQLQAPCSVLATSREVLNKVI